ncbi:MAG: hypothetical protein OEU92_22300 [Alphaproteobacteria bacterium]|nr:hypothetical protein [Alphaproteobacteria bacterium]
MEAGFEPEEPQKNRDYLMELEQRKAVHDKAEPDLMYLEGDETLREGDAELDALRDNKAEHDAWREADPREDTSLMDKRGIAHKDEGNDDRSEAEAAKELR